MMFECDIDIDRPAEGGRDGTVQVLVLFLISHRGLRLEAQRAYTRNVR